MTSYYIAYPRCEEINCPSDKKIIKVGVSEKISFSSEQAYVNSRYGRYTTLLACEYDGMKMKPMKAVEQRVLHELIHTYGYELQRYKQEHFVIGDSVSEEKTFVYIVRSLYKRFREVHQDRWGRWVTENQPYYANYPRHNNKLNYTDLNAMHSRRSLMEKERIYKEKESERLKQLERERLERYEKEQLEQEQKWKEEVRAWRERRRLKREKRIFEQKTAIEKLHIEQRNERRIARERRNNIY